MSNAYGIPDHILRQLATEYLAQEEGGGAPAPMLTGEQQNFAGMVPSYDLEGDPYSMTAMLNQLQDINQLMADPLFQGGGGVGGWSQEAFQPVVNYEVVDAPEYQRWKNYLNTPDSFEGMIALELQGGGTPMSALRKIQARVAENPEGQVAQQLHMFFPALDPDGLATNEIDWPGAAQAATEIDALRADIPQIGGTGALTMPDGTVVPAGEIMEVDGQLVKRTEEPSELMQHFQELGLPSPYEEYTTEMLMGPEWEAQRDEYMATLDDTQIMRDLMSQAARNVRDYQPRDWSAQLATREPVEEGEEEGAARPRPVPGAGMPTEPQGTEDAYWMPQGSQQARFQAGYAIQDPNQWRQWYEEHLPEMDENQRWEALTYAQDRSFSGGSPETMAQWSGVFNDLKSDLVTEGGTIPGDIATALTEPYEPTAADAVMDAARDATSPQEFASVLADGAASLNEGQLAELGNYALDQSLAAASGADNRAWQDIGGPLVRGEYQPPGGGAGNRPQVRGLMGAQTLEPNAKLPPGSYSKRVEAGDFDAALTPGRSFFPTEAEEPEPPDTEFLRQLGIAPPPPPVDPNAPVMRALPAGPASPEAIAEAQVMPYPPVPNEPGRGAGVGTDALNTAYQQWLAEQNAGEVPPPDYTMESATDQLQRLAMTATGPPGSEAATAGQFMEPGYYGHWGRNEGGILPGAYGTQTEYVPPGTTRAEYLEMIGAPPEALGWPYNAIAQANAENVEPWDSEKAAQVARTNQLMRARMSEELARQQFEQDWIQSGRPIRDMPGQTWDVPPGVEYPEPRIEARNARRQQEAQDLMQQYITGERTELPTRPQREGPWDETIYGPNVNEPFTPGWTAEELQNILPQGTGQITAANYGGGPLPQQIQQYLTNAAQGGRQVRTGETQEPETENQIEQYLRNVTAAGGGFMGRIETGERRGQRTEAERRRLARERAPRGLQGEQYEPTTGTWGEGLRGQSRRARSRFREQWLTQQAMKQQVYGPEEGYARGMAAGLRARGASPLQQVYAQRIQNIANAGIPIGAQPGLITY